MTSVQTRLIAERLLDTLQRQEPGAAVVLIGSAARDAATERSDVDFLVVRPEERQAEPAPKCAYALGSARPFATLMVGGPIR